MNTIKDLVKLNNKYVVMYYYDSCYSDVRFYFELTENKPKDESKYPIQY